MPFKLFNKRNTDAKHSKANNKSKLDAVKRGQDIINARNKLIYRIKSFENLEVIDLHSNQSIIVTHKVVQKALDFAIQLSPLPKAFPTFRNSIQLEWEKDGLYLEMEVFEDKIEIYNEYKENDDLVATIGEE